MSHPNLRFLGHADSHLGIMGPVNHDLVSAPVSQAEVAGTGKLTYHGGALIAAPRLHLIFIGDWQGDPFAIGDFAEAMMTRGYLDPLVAYGMTGAPSFGGIYQIQRQLPATLTQSQCAGLARGLFADGIPLPADDNIYALMLPVGVTATFDNEPTGSCVKWCGYHATTQTQSGQRVNFTVQPATTCGPCHGAQTPADAMQMVLAHEVAESVTDPTAQGWYDDADGSENADKVAWIPLQWGPYLVQGYYTNEAGNTIGPYRDVAPPPPPQPQPDPKARAIAIAANVRNGFTTQAKGKPRSAAGYRAAGADAVVQALGREL